MIVGGTPTIQNRLAWVIVFHGADSSGPNGGVPAPGYTAPPRDPCYFATVVISVDAMTGDVLLREEHGES
jgi:hypothetical protein